MSIILAVSLAVLVSYLIGSFPTSFILVKLFKGTDVRQAGSGNAGATNVLRVAGKLPAIVTLVVDVLKGAVVVSFIAGYCHRFTGDMDYEFLRCLLGLSVICGHIWPVFLGFRGGKGVATTLGVAVILAPAIFLPSLVIWIAVFMVSNYVSLASIMSLMAFPVISVIFWQSFPLALFSVIICSIVIYKHKSNIIRLLRGEESRTVIFKSR